VKFFLGCGYADREDAASPAEIKGGRVSRDKELRTPRVDGSARLRKSDGAGAAILAPPRD
jgi:hypothetical protein